MSTNEEIVFLRKRVAELEKQLDSLRLSRRVLMDLLEQIEKEKNVLVKKLERTSKCLQKYKRLNSARPLLKSFEIVEFNNHIKD